MRIIKISFLVSIVCITISAQNFFPIKVGNAYQVKNFWSWWGPGGNGETGTDYYAITVVTDSVINNDIYFRFSNNNILKDEYWFSYNSQDQKVYVKLPNDSTLKLAIDFNASLDSNYISYLRGSPTQFTSGGITSEVVLGDTHSVYSMHGSISVDNFTYQFTNDVGLSYFRAWGGIIQAGYQSKHDVISAIIDSVIYSPIVTNIDSIYPVEDRPVDTFPYLLTIPYTSSYIALVDSFYLNVEHVRSDTLIQANNYNLSISNPSQLTLYLDSLLVGDKIKLRATITDTSIYNNVDQFPDTGWIAINVLPPTVGVENETKPFHYNLFDNYPNPFNASTKIKYEIPEISSVTIKVYDILGNEVAILVNEEQPVGSYEVEFSIGQGSSPEIASGIYFYQLKAGSFVETKKMLLLK